LAQVVASDGADRALLGRLVQEASAALEEAGHPVPPERVRRIEELLLGVSTATDEERRALREGRLEHPLELGDLDALLALAAKKRRGAAAAAAPAAPAPRRSLREQLAAAHEAAKKAAQTAREAADRLAES